MEELFSTIPPEVEREVTLSFDIADNISNILERKKLSQKQFAQMIEKKEQEISRWLNGSHNFTIKTLAKISAVLDVEIQDIICKPKQPFIILMPLTSNTLNIQPNIENKKRIKQTNYCYENYWS